MERRDDPPAADDSTGLPPPGTVSFSAPTSAPGRDAFLELMRTHGASPRRYAILGEIARGGMGAIHRAFDRVTRRHVALKRMLDELGGSTAPPTRRDDPSVFGRFVAEAQVTAQLDHPGIVPVHEIGLDDQGHVFFAMKLVDGLDLRTVFEQHRSGLADWNLPRVTAILLKVCEAMAFAHARGVIHRDLKPANVMVGRYGEVYVMDWGLARVLGSRDLAAMAPRGDADPSLSAAVDASTPLPPPVTLEGDVLGTPAYMAPEQAEGRRDEITGQTDVYSVGAMLYHLLAGHSPYDDDPLARGSPRTILSRALVGPPTPLSDRAPDAPPPLVAICEKAMARDRSRRYDTMDALAADLRAFLEQRVVAAYRTGALAEARAWVRRNRGLALTASIGAALLVGVGGYAHSRVRDERNKAITAADAADRERQNVLRLADSKRLEDLVDRQESLWPSLPQHVPSLEAWLAEARALVARLPLHRATLQTLRTSALPYTDDDARHDRETHPEAERRSRLRDQRRTFAAARLTAPDEIARRDAAVRDLDSEIETLTRRTEERRTYRFEDAETRWRHDVLADVVARIEALGATGPGAEYGVTLVALERRLEAARSIARLTIDERAADWERVKREVVADPRFGGFELTPQIGLIPLFADPESGLQEFAHYLSGSLPSRDPSGRLNLADDAAIVLVLLPGGEFSMGAQNTTPDGANYDPEANSDTIGPGGEPVRVTLAPFFLAKHELTQAQWLTLTGTNPSFYPVLRRVGGHVTTPRHPVEQVHWADLRKTLQRAHLEFPTEAQWEYGARAGSGKRWFPGNDVTDLQGHGNIADAYAMRFAPDWPGESALDDGYLVHAPVGSFRANAFGLHDTLGNVFEWCRDGDADYALPPREGDGERIVADAQQRIFRGGCFSFPASYATSAFRDRARWNSAASHTGARAARAIDAPNAKVATPR